MQSLDGFSSVDYVAHLVVGILSGVEQVAPLAQPHVQAHHQAFTERVDGRVGHLQADASSHASALPCVQSHGGDAPALVRQIPDAKIQMHLVYLEYWTLNSMHQMIYPKVLFHANFSIKEAVRSPEQSAA